MIKKYKLPCIFLVMVITATAFALFLTTKSTNSFEAPITLFPLENYDQNISTWIDPANPDYDTPLMSAADQKTEIENLYNHLYATGDNAASPWDKRHVEEFLAEKLYDRIEKEKLVKRYCIKCNPGQLSSSDKNQIINNDYTENLGENIGCSKDNKGIGYAANFRPYNAKWAKDIFHNMNLDQFVGTVKFRPENRGIAVKNISARALPTNDPYFSNPSLPGNGYPFDNLQESAVWVGTPVYIIGKTLDQQWFLVLTPSYIAWVESDSIAKAGNYFIKRWQRHAKKKMAAINKTGASIFNSSGKYILTTYIGTILPVKTIDDDSILTLIPIIGLNHSAQIAIAKINRKDANIVPLAQTPHNFANIISSLAGRPYGWGNSYFYNDCSSELKNLFTPFGIWLPRNSFQQLKSRKMIDLSSLSFQRRLNYLMKNGKKFLTVIYIRGHVMLYIGHYPGLDNKNPTIMTYQNMWGLSPKDRSYRSVIGKSVFLPLLKTYSENPKLVSLGNKPVFQIFHLDKP